MKVVNIMLSRDLGGIQKAFANYSKMLVSSGHNVLNIVSEGSQIAHELHDYVEIKNWFQWDLYSILQLRNILKKFNPDCIIAHTGRAMKFCYYAKFGMNYPLIGAAHNYNYKWMCRCDYIFSITHHLADFLVSKGMQRYKIYILGNTFTTIMPEVVKPFRNPTTIGTLSRLVPQKGIDVFLKAMAILQQRGFSFKVVIGGDGVQKDELQNLALHLGLQNVHFIGWVEDKVSFFEGLDIFCMPSLHEPFGIVMLEAMMHSVPIVATKAEGPSENIQDGENGLLCNISDSHDLAEKILLLASNPELARSIAHNSYSYVVKNFSDTVIQKLLNSHLKQICTI